MELRVHINNDLMFVDLSYYVFYRYYASLSWLRRKSENINIDDLINDKDFMKTYTKMFEKVLEELYVKHYVDPSCVFLVRDSARESIWRGETYPSYKATRQNRGGSLTDVFAYTYNEILPKLASKYGYNPVHFDTLEADDVIAIIVKKIRCTDRSSKITIITNDNDYIQLLIDDENTCIFNLQGDQIKDRVNTDPKTYLQLKIITGDKSDNIPAIAKMIGPKTAQKLCSQEELQRFFEKNKEAASRYEMNKLLIDFGCIPANKRAIVESALLIENVST